MPGECAHMVLQSHHRFESNLVDFSEQRQVTERIWASSEAKFFDGCVQHSIGLSYSLVQVVSMPSVWSALLSGHIGGEHFRGAQSYLVTLRCFFGKPEPIVHVKLRLVVRRFEPRLPARG